MSKKIIKGQTAMIEGINAVADTIKVTLGPKGKCVALQSAFSGPEITRDGATVAKGIELKDPGQSMGATLVKNASIKTEEQAGDSTSSTAIFIQEFVSKGLKYIDNPEVNLNEVKDGMEKAVRDVIEYIKTHSIQVDQDLEKIRKVATISANNDPKVGDLIVEAMEKVGLDGIITADFTSGLDTTIEVTEGFKIERGWASPHFVNSSSDGKCILENPVILVCSERLSSIPVLAPILEAIAKQGRELLMIVDEIDEVVLSMLAFNNLQGALKCCVIKGIDFGDSRKNIMEDIAISVGAKHICQEYGLSLSDVTLEMFGGAKKAVISKESAIIYDGLGDSQEIQDRLLVLKDRANDPNVSDYEKHKFLTRISGLSGGVAVIKAGGASDTEKNNRKATIEDAILASQSAITEGVVPGGGYTLLKASWETKVPKNLTTSESLGYKLVLESLPVITKTIAENYGLSGDVVVSEIKRLKKGFNAKTGQYCDLLEAGVLDSAKALRVCLENAVSAAGMCLLTDSLVITEEKDSSEQ